MAVKIRLKRMGKKKAPSYRVVVAEASSPRDGRIIANIGWYNPRTEPSTVVIDEEKALKWLHHGAQPTDSVTSLLKRTGILDRFQTAKEAAKAATQAAREARIAEKAKEPVAVASPIAE
jgi:small subunit ribosomal protein S16